MAHPTADKAAPGLNVQSGQFFQDARDEAGLQDAEEKQDDKKGDPVYHDTFGDEEYAEVKYKVLSWWYVYLLSTAPVEDQLTDIS